MLFFIESGNTLFIGVSNDSAEKWTFTLHVRRRRYLDADGRNIILNQYPLNTEGTKVSVEYGLFFKDDHGQPAINCRALREALSD